MSPTWRRLGPLWICHQTPTALSTVETVERAVVFQTGRLSGARLTSPEWGRIPARAHWSWVPSRRESPPRAPPAVRWSWDRSSPDHSAWSPSASRSSLRSAFPTGTPHPAHSPPERSLQGHTLPASWASPAAWHPGDKTRLLPRHIPSSRCWAGWRSSRRTSAPPPSPRAASPLH